MKRNKYTQKEAEICFLKHNLILKDNYKDNKTSLYCMDLDGYKFLKSLGDINKKPSKFHPKNPFSIYNIKKYLSDNDFHIKLLTDKYLNSQCKMSWQCECGQVFKASWNMIFAGKRYCNFCSKSKRFDNLRDYTSIVKKKCQQRGYKLLTQHINRGTDVFEYSCEKHGVKTSTYHNITYGHWGCYECGIEERGIKHRLEETKIKELVESKGLIYVGCDYDNEGRSCKKVNIHVVCPNHVDKGVQKMKYYNILNGNGKCLYCVGYGRTKEDLQNELDEMHGLVTVLEYNDYSNPIFAKCNICGYEWLTNGVGLTQGHTCPNCTKSKFEISVKSILNKWGYKFKDQICFDECRDKRPLPFDFYIEDFNILIEVDGEGHYMPIPRSSSMSEEDGLKTLKTTQYHDKIKTKYCKKKNIPLIRVPYWEKDNLEYFLFDELLKHGAIEKIA